MYIIAWLWLLSEQSPISTDIPSNNNSDEVIVRMSNTGIGIHPKFFQGCLQNSLATSYMPASIYGMQRCCLLEAEGIMQEIHTNELKYIFWSNSILK